MRELDSADDVDGEREEKGLAHKRPLVRTKRKYPKCIVRFAGCERDGAL